MLNDNEIMKCCRFWAAVYTTKTFQFDELLSVGYIAARNLDHVHKLNKTVKFTLLRYIINNTPHTLDDLTKINKNNVVSKDNKIDTIDSLVKAIHKTEHIHPLARDIIRLRFLEGKSYKYMQNELMIKGGLLGRLVPAIKDKLVKELKGLVR